MEAYRHVTVIKTQRLTSKAHMSDPPRREARPSRPYGSEPGARPRGRDHVIPPGAPRTPPAGARTPRRDPGSAGGMKRAGEVGGGWGDSRGSDPRGGDPGWGGRDSGPRGTGGNGWDPGPPAGRGGDPGAGAQTRRMSAQPGEGRAPRTRPTGTRAPGTQPTETRATETRATGTRATGTRATGTRATGSDWDTGDWDTGDWDTGGHDSAPRHPRRCGAGPWRTARFPRAEEFSPVASLGAAKAVGRAAGRPRSLHHRRQRGHRRHPHHGGPERARFPAGTVHRGRNGGRGAGHPAQGRPDDLPRPGAFLSGGRPDKRRRIRPVRRFVQDGAGHRRGAVDRQRLLRHGASHCAGPRDHHRPLASLAPRQVGQAQPGLAGPADRPRQDRSHPGAHGPGWHGTR